MSESRSARDALPQRLRQARERIFRLYGAWGKQKIGAEQTTQNKPAS
jgi:hypothetical protein